MMEVTRATPAGASSETALDGEWLLGSSGDGNGLRYQQRFGLQLPTGGLAEELLVGEGTSLRLQAQRLISNALDPSAPERANVAQADATGLRVTLPIPRIIHSIRFASDHSPGGKTTQLFRTDGDTVAEEPFASRLNPVTAELSIQSNGGPGKAIAMSGSNLLQVKQEAQLHAAEGAQSGLSTGELGVIGGSVLVRLLSTPPEQLYTSSLTEFNVSTGPENLRVGMRLPALGSELFYLPHAFEIEQDVDLGESLRSQLTSAVQRLIGQLAASGADSAPRPTLPDPLEIELVVESDAPCRFTFSQFKLYYRLARESFPNGAPKQVLRFTDDQPQQQQLGIALPASVSVIQARLTIAGDPVDEADSGSAPSAPSPLNTLIETATDESLRIDPMHHWLSPLMVSSPMLIDAIDLLVTTLSPSSYLQLEITRDRDGQHDGERLASAELELGHPGRRAPIRFHLDTRLQLQPGNCWLRLQSRDGNAVWHLRASPGAHSLQANSNRVTVSGIDGATGIARWIPAEGSATEPQPIPEIRLSGQMLAAERRENNWSYDLAPALGDMGGSGLITRELELMTGQRGPVTLYPPRIEFEL